MWLLSTAFNKNLNNIFTRVSNTKLMDYELSRAQICLTIQQILENSTEGIAINLTRKIPILFEAKNFVMESNFVKISIWACIDFRICRLFATFPRENIRYQGPHIWSKLDNKLKGSWNIEYFKKKIKKKDLASLLNNNNSCCNLCNS